MAIFLFIFSLQRILYPFLQNIIKQECIPVGILCMSKDVKDVEG